MMLSKLWYTNTAGRLMLLMLLATLLAAVAGWRLSARAAAPGQFHLTALGHSCFLLETPGGTRVLFDPFGPQLGYPVVRVRADVVLISHNHFDHNHREMAEKTENGPLILAGVEGEPGQFVAVNKTFQDVSIRSIASWHDRQRGAERGPNAIFVVESGGLRIAHLGDLGHELTREQVKEIGVVDVLLIPVGGTFTIDEKQARRTVAQLAPRRLVVPMHHAAPSLKMKLPLAPLQPFLKGWPTPPRQETGPTIAFSSGSDRKGPEIVILNP